MSLARPIGRGSKLGLRERTRYAAPPCALSCAHRPEIPVGPRVRYLADNGPAELDGAAPARPFEELDPREREARPDRVDIRSPRNLNVLAHPPSLPGGPRPT